MPISGARKILLVEDQAIIALDERLVLERAGHEVITTGSGEQAINLVREHPDLDLVLMDIDLGAGIDGTESAQRILAERELPIVFLTGHAEQSMVDRVRGITRYGYVMKAEICDSRHRGVLRTGAPGSRVGFFLSHCPPGRRGSSHSGVGHADLRGRNDRRCRSLEREPTTRFIVNFPL